jgi:hypothetical protein
VKRAERGASPPSRGASEPPRFELDRAWLLRGILLVVAIGLVLLVAKVSVMTFGGATNRLHRLDPGHAPAAATSREGARENR